MRKTFTGLATLLLLIVVAQFFFAASGAFSTAPDEEAYRPHHALGYVIFLVPVLMAVVAALARMPGRLIWISALIAGLTSVQVVIAELAGSFGALFFGLHAVNGLAIFAVTAVIAWQAWTPSATMER
jgi:hypothetical protein